MAGREKLQGEIDVEFFPEILTAPPAYHLAGQLALGD